MENNSLPAKGKSTGRKPKYNFDTLNVNEYIVVKQSKKLSASQASRQYGTKHSKTFATRTVDKEVRIYRTK